MAKAKPAPRSAGKMIYYFSKTKTEGKGVGKEIMGGKGANLAEMTSIGLPVPPGFTITTEVCDRYYKHGKKLPAGLMDEVRRNISRLEKELSKKFGDAKSPLLVSVRSGAAVSMPGMMNTILNLGLTDISTAGLAAATGNERFAYDAYRRLINMFGDVVMEVGHEHYEHAFDAVKYKYGVKQDTEVPAEGLIELCHAYKEVYKKHTGKDFPQDPYAQLEAAIEAVFKSWMQHRAVRYREVENIKGLLGTAVNVQSMVYGNMGDDSGTGVAFTRNPSTGENKFYGEFLVNAQAKTSSQAFARRSRSRKCPPGTRRSTSSSWKSRTSWNTTTTRCTPSSSRSSAAHCSCSRPAPASGPARPPCALPATWSRRS
jgi:pyruvate,orthophosphate dikinase